MFGEDNDKLNQPYGIAIDSSNRVYVSEYLYNNTLVRVSVRLSVCLSVRIHE